MSYHHLDQGSPNFSKQGQTFFSRCNARATTSISQQNYFNANFQVVYPELSVIKFL